MADNADVNPYEGENIDTTWTDTHRDEVGLQAEAYLCVLLKYDAVTNWASLNAIYKIILTEYVARSVAMAGILFNMENYTTRFEAEDMVTVHANRLETIEILLNNADVQDFLGV
uniref:Uncharacterized protein n=1 Tax=viral metagenome TaxID=1070528 RepID=A0A6H1ZVE2_9ZZZZ